MRNESFKFDVVPGAFASDDPFCCWGREKFLFLFRDYGGADVLEVEGAEFLFPPLKVAPLDYRDALFLAVSLYGLGEGMPLPF